MKRRCHLKVFTGPFLDQIEFNRLKRSAGSDVQVKRFTSDFLSFLVAADLSVSMGGYNTTMNILASGAPSLVWPFGQNREQGLRARRLADLGVIRVLEDEDLRPDRLARIMDQWISRTPRPFVNINLNGAVNTSKWIENRMNPPPPRHEGPYKEK